MPTGFSWSELRVDAARVNSCNAAALPSGGRDFVLYWCQAHPRVEDNAALDVALALGERLGLPVAVYQALRPDYPHASQRLHAFALEGMADFAATLAARGLAYWAELPRTREERRPRVAELSRRAAAVVTDWVPSFVFPRHVAGAARTLEVPLFAVDASCVVPMQRVPGGKQLGAYTLRPKLRKLWPEYLDARLAERRVRTGRLEAGFALADPVLARERLGEFAVDASVAPVPGVHGGRRAALAALEAFVTRGLADYAECRSDPGRDRQSGLSPYLHWGHLFAGEAARAARVALGDAHPGVAAFLEELLVRRELGFNYCLHTPPERQLDLASLPAWARASLDAHRADARPHVYSLEELDAARTHDGLWNASQRELRARGRMHGYLRMLWGKKLLEWSPTPEEALRRMAHLNDRYALDGRDPASVANFLWVLGLHDRPFQERPILGKVRPMSSARTAEKFDLRPYLQRWAAAGDAPVRVPRRPRV